MLWHGRYLADRLIHDWYAYDGRFHAEARAKAEEGLEALEHGVDIHQIDAVVASIEKNPLEERASEGPPPRARG